MAKDETFTGQSGARWRYWTDQLLGYAGRIRRGLRERGAGRHPDGGQGGLEAEGVYRFYAAGFAVPNNDTFGPHGRTHGLKYGDFFGKWGRPFMLRQAAFHPWQKSVEPLTSESLLGLFREAVDLRPPDARTGFWS